MANYPLPWGTYQEINIDLLLDGQIYPWDPSTMKLYLTAKLDLANTDAEAVFQLSTEESPPTLIMQLDQSGHGIGKIYPADTTSLPPEEKTVLEFDLRVIKTVSSTDIRPIVLNRGKFTVGNVVTQQVA